MHQARLQPKKQIGVCITIFKLQFGEGKIFVKTHTNKNILYLHVVQ